MVTFIKCAACLCSTLNLFSSALKGPHKSTDFDFLSQTSHLVSLYQQDAVEDNEQRKKQEQAMREKLLAEEAKQHDPKV